MFGVISNYRLWNTPLPSIKISSLFQQSSVELNNHGSSAQETFYCTVSIQSRYPTSSKNSKCKSLYIMKVKYLSLILDSIRAPLSRGIPNHLLCTHTIPSAQHHPSSQLASPTPWPLFFSVLSFPDPVLAHPVTLTPK